MGNMVGSISRFQLVHGHSESAFSKKRNLTPWRRQIWCPSQSQSQMLPGHSQSPSCAGFPMCQLQARVCERWHIAKRKINSCYASAASKKYSQVLWTSLHFTKHEKKMWKGVSWRFIGSISVSPVRYGQPLRCLRACYCCYCYFI